MRPSVRPQQPRYNHKGKGKRKGRGRSKGGDSEQTQAGPGWVRDELLCRAAPLVQLRLG